MTFSENIPAFFSDFGESILWAAGGDVASAETVTGIVERGNGGFDPMATGVAENETVTVTVAQEDIPDIERRTVISVDGVWYGKVRKVRADSNVATFTAERRVVQERTVTRAEAD
jgi:hypothetical protein